MDAIVVNLKDVGLRTPEQAVRVFYATFEPEAVKAGLFDAFRGFALAAENLGESGLPELKDVAQLFDGLISLVNGVYELQGMTIGRCVICGRYDNRSSLRKPPGRRSGPGDRDHAG